MGRARARRLHVHAPRSHSCAGTRPMIGAARRGSSAAPRRTAPPRAAPSATFSAPDLQKRRGAAGGGRRAPVGRVVCKTAGNGVRCRVVGHSAAPRSGRPPPLPKRRVLTARLQRGSGEWSAVQFEPKPRSRFKARYVVIRSRVLMSLAGVVQTLRRCSGS